MSRFLGAVEGLFAYGLLSTVASFAVHSLLPAGAPALTRNAVRLAAVAVSFAAVYWPRFAPVPRRVALRAFVGVPDAPTALLCLLHAALGVAFACASARAGAAPFACINASDTVVGVVLEEVLHRFAVFYIVLQRSGGDLPFALGVAASMFAAAHVGAAWGSAIAVGSAHVAAAAAAGVVYGLSFAVSGSLAGAVGAHALNNVAALLWLPVTASTAERSGGACVLAPHPATLPLLLAQLGAYAVAAAALAARLRTELRSGAFRARHPLVYSSADGGAPIDAKAR